LLRQITKLESHELDHRRGETAGPSKEAPNLLRQQRVFSFPGLNRLTSGNRWSVLNQARTLSFVRAIGWSIKPIATRSVFPSPGKRLRRGEVMQTSQAGPAVESSTPAAAYWQTSGLRFGFRRLSFTQQGNRQLLLGGGLAQQAIRAPALSADLVFAQRVGQQKSDDQGDRQVQTREITELVKKELKRTLVKEGALSRFTHDDYAEITDQVYSSLVQRLTVERERLGWR